MFKKIIYNFSRFRAIGALFLASLGICHANAFELPAGTKTDSFLGVEVNDIRQTDNGQIEVDMTIDLSKVKMKSNIESVYTPMFVNGTDTLRMPSFAVTGRNRMYWSKRNNALLPVTFYKKELLPGTYPVLSDSHITVAPAQSGKVTDKSDKWNIGLSSPYRDWMETAKFTVDLETRGCANCLKGNPDGVDFYALAQNDFVQRSFFPEFLYVTPVAVAVKTSEISERAYIDFPVNRIEIYPDYRRNPEELAKIRANIDSVRNDKDITITSLHISGTASPEGGYQNNIRLAKGRTEALKDYVQGLYRFPPGFITTSFEPVDWLGLAQFLEMVMSIRDYGKATTVVDVTDPRAQVRAMDSIRFDQFQNIDFDPATINNILPDAGKILAIVDSDIEPFARNTKIKTTYPDQYAWLLANVYPALRHSDYRIGLEIKSFTEVSEILEVMETAPQKLSLAELFVAANSQEPGSELYNRAFELAVTMFPTDQTANLNAATAAMQRGDLIQAERYLSKVTDESPESDYANAMLLLLKGQEDEALAMFKSLQNSLNPEVAAKASRAYEGIESVRKSNSRRFVPLD